MSREIRRRLSLASLPQASVCVHACVCVHLHARVYVCACVRVWASACTSVSEDSGREGEGLHRVSTQDSSCHGVLSLVPAATIRAQSSWESPEPLSSPNSSLLRAVG